MLKFYVYAYISKSGRPYYIGKGTGNRAWSKHKGINLPATDHIVIMEDNLSEVGAYALERRYIKWYGRKDLKNGVLLNRTDGGEGGTNMTPSQRNTISQRCKTNPPRKGTKTSSLAKARMKEAALKKEHPRYWQGKKRDASTRAKISNTKKGMIQTKEHKQKNSDKIKLLWQDPVWRAKVLESRKRNVPDISIQR